MKSDSQLCLTAANGGKKPPTPAEEDNYIIDLVNSREAFLKIRTEEELMLPTRDQDMVGDTSKKVSFLDVCTSGYQRTRHRRHFCTELYLECIQRKKISIY